MIIVGTAGWSVPRASARRFPPKGTHLQRYASVLRGAEINSSFYRNHSAQTYAKWGRQTPRGFRFSVKLPREITHERALRDARRPLEDFLACVTALRQRLGPLLVQLPPSLEFDSRVVRRFFGMFRTLFEGTVVCEPRHRTWFDGRADALLAQFHVARAAADPAVVPAAAKPGGWNGIAYYRLHGSPRMYWSVYDRRSLARWTVQLRAHPRGTPVWCIFDNTAAGGATANALQVAQPAFQRKVLQGL